jgi:hypothetical protein
MKTIEKLTRIKGRVYVFLSDPKTQKQFLKNAEAEGFRFSDGAAPTSREADDLYALYADKTICFAGWTGHMAFRSEKASALEPMTWVDYRKYLSGSPFCIVKRIRPKGALLKKYSRAQKERPI